MRDYKGEPLVFFYGHSPENSLGIFSQFFFSGFYQDGYVYPTAEHFMMASKARLFNDKECLAMIMSTDTPYSAKRYGRSVQLFDPVVWDKNKYRIVFEGNVLKFTQNTEAARTLIDTGDAYIVEASPTDKIWGIGLSITDPARNDPSNWKGQNLLGQVLMDVRDFLNG